MTTKKGLITLVACTFLAGAIGFQSGRYQERKIHDNDYLELMSWGTYKNPRMDLRVRFGEDELRMRDIMMYAADAAPRGSLASDGWKNDEHDPFAKAYRHRLSGAENLHDVYPEKFKVIETGANWVASTVKIVRGKDTEFRMGLY